MMALSAPAWPQRVRQRSGAEARDHRIERRHCWRGADDLGRHCGRTVGMNNRFAEWRIVEKYHRRDEAAAERVAGAGAVDRSDSLCGHAVIRRVIVVVIAVRDKTT